MRCSYCERLEHIGSIQQNVTTEKTAAKNCPAPLAAQVQQLTSQSVAVVAVAAVLVRRGRVRLDDRVLEKPEALES